MKSNRQTHLVGEDYKILQYIHGFQHIKYNSIQDTFLEIITRRNYLRADFLSIQVEIKNGNFLK
jgi:hypothetical protein